MPSKLSTAQTIVVVLGAVFGIVVLAALVLRDGDSEGATANRSTTFAEAVDALENDSGEAAAVVNGSEIPLAKVHAFAVLRNATGFESTVPQDITQAEYLDQLIDTELLYQEAVRRQLEPSDDEVLALATATKQGLAGLVASDSEQGNDLRRVFEAIEGTDYHYEAYDSAPVMLDGFRQQIAVNALREQLLADAGFEQGSPERNDREAVEAVVNEYANSLRATADIEILATLD